MPYRQPRLVRAWELNARKAWTFVGWAGVVLTLAGPVSAALAGISIPPAYLLVALPGIFLLAMWTWAGDGYRVHGGRAGMHLFEDRVEIPRPRRPGVDVFPLANLSMRFLTIRGKVKFVTVSEVLVLDLQSGDRRRQIAHHLVGSPEALERLADDIARTQRGEPPAPDPPWTPGKDSPARTDLEKKLDAELAKLG